MIDSGEWWDLGAREQILSVHKAKASSGAPWISSNATIAPDACVRGASAIGDDATIGAGAVIEDSIVWSGAVIEPGSTLRGCIVTGNATVSGNHTDADL